MLAAKALESVPRLPAHRSLPQPIGSCHEENISAQQDQARQKSRLSGPDGHPRWTPGACPAARQGAAAPVGLSRRNAAARWCGAIGLAAGNSRSAGFRVSTMASSGFPRSARLLQAAEFRAVFSDARYKVSCRNFLVLALPADKDGGRLGLVVSKKNVPGAVQRNRVKRLVRERFRHSRAGLSGVDMVVLARKDVHKLGNAAMRQRLESLWRELRAKMRRHAGKQELRQS